MYELTILPSVNHRLIETKIKVPFTYILHPKPPSNLNVSELERAMLLYSYVGHAYMWGKKHVENTIPKELATTWFAISEKLERPPILSYASYALNNWKMLDDTKPFDLENNDLSKFSSRKYDFKFESMTFASYSIAT